MAGAGLFGRHREVELIERFLTTERGGALLLEGAGGIGKTSLWEHGLALAQQRGMLIVSARCAEQERHLSYAGMADLLAGIELSSIAALPVPQLAAIESALLIRPSSRGVNPQAVAAALLSVLRDLGASRSLLVAVDDVGWLDEPTAAALAFAARRLQSARLLFTARGDDGSPVVRALARTALERVTVGPLDSAEVRQLLHARLGLSLSRRTMQRICATCAGNPLYALELGKALAGSSASPLGTELPLTRNLEEELSGRVAQLEPAARQLLLAVALGPSTAASAMPGIEALAAALESGVVIVEGDRIRPTHPLLGTAAVAHASPTERREVHRRLAAAANDDEQRAHHLALATQLPDGATAATVAAGAAQAMRRGAAASAAELGKQAVRLTPISAPERVERQLTAAEYMSAAGELEQGRGLLPREIQALPDLRQRVRAYLLAADLGLAGPPLSPDRPDKAWSDRALRESQVDTDLYAGVLARCAGDEAVEEIRNLSELEGSLVAVESAASRLEPSTQLLFISSLAWIRSLRGASLGELAARAESLEAETHGLPLHHGVERLVALRQMWRGETDAPRAALGELLRLADLRGEGESYLAIRLHLCELELRAGNLDAAETLLDEWAQESSEGPPNAPSAYARCRALLAAQRGRGHDVERWLAGFAGDGFSGAVTDRWQWLEAQRARGLALLLTGSAVAAAARLRSVWDYTLREGVTDPGIFPVAGDLVEALVGSGAHADAEAVTRAVSEAALERDHPWAAATAKRCAALIDLGTPDAGRELIGSADAFQALGLGFERARTVLTLAVSYREQRQHQRSAQAFEQAAALFDALGSPGWARHAREQPTRGPRRAGEQGASLTPTEEKIARLVATGSRNREVAAELFISEKTVEAHLSHIYAKLELRSRTELAARLHALIDPADPS